MLYIAVTRLLRTLVLRGASPPARGSTSAPHPESGGYITILIWIVRKGSAGILSHKVSQSQA